MLRACAAEPPPKVVHADGIENLFQVTDHVYSGSQPEGDAGFAALQKLGVKTIISVDGTKPDVDRAAKFGLRYIHLPHGYDGISSNVVVRLVKAASTAEGSLFVHCHHGLHRGPAAVGVICQATAGWIPAQATDWLRSAGTSTNYAGLYRANTEFRPPTAQELAAVPATFPSKVEVSALVDGMVKVDHLWDNLKAIQKAGWRGPPSQPDLVPASGALLLQEAYRELQRTVDARKRGQEFLEHLGRAEAQAKDLHSLLQGQTGLLDEATTKRAKDLFKSAGQTCGACHKKFRN